MQVIAKEIVGLVGPSGSGKTTLLQVLLGLTPNDDGKVRIDEVTGAHKRPKFLYSVGYVPEKRVCPPDFTPRNLIEFRGSLTGLAEHASRSRAQDLLARHDLTGIADVPLDNLDADAVEAAHLLASVVNRPKVWLVDTPRAIPVFTALVQDARDKERAVVLCTRDMDLARAHCDRILELRNGAMLVPPGNVTSSV